jgi:glycosyltransferase involved in cell wall biosynthesis
MGLKALGGSSGVLFYRQLCKKLYFAPVTNQVIRFIKRGVNFGARRVIHHNIFNFNAGLAREDFEYLLRIAKMIRADVIWLGYGNISYPLLDYIKSHSSYKVVVDTDSVWSRFILRKLPYTQNGEEKEKLERLGQEKIEEETWGTQLADVTTAVSEVDAKYYAALAHHPEQVHIFSNVIDINNYQRIPPPAMNFKKPCIYLAGTFGKGSPMEEAARWVIRDILPLIKQQIPDIHLYIVGKSSDVVLSDVDDAHITVTGELPSVLSYLCHADVALVPLRFESGTRFKILEAGACGIPIVSTILGAEGLPIIHQKSILLADEPEPFANAVVTLISDRELARELAQNLKHLVQNRFSIPSLVKEGQEILDYLINQVCDETV